MREQVDLAALTTFGLGGKARYFAAVRTVEELRRSLRYARERGLATLVLGGGSNTLVADAGFDGLVIKIELAGLERRGDTLVAAAGESWDALVAHAVAQRLWGIENLSGIPGSVGAAPVQNVGAYGSEVKDTLAWLEAFDTHSGEVLRFENAACGFGYRTSRFKREPGRFVILRAAFALGRDGAPKLGYKDLAAAFAGKPAPGLREVREAVLAIRAGKFPDLSLEGTAGSFFLNPTVPPQLADALAARYPGLPRYEAQGGVKLSLAWLLDNALRLKGLAVGGARLFEHQPLVIAAKRDARARDVVALAQKVKEEAKKILGLDLEEEVRIVS